MQNISALFGPWIIGFYALLFLLTALLYRAVPGARKRLGGTALMALFSIAGILTARVMGGSAAGHLPKLIEVAARMLAMAAAINLAGVLAFALVMPKLRAGVSKFVQDLILAGGYLVGALAVISASGADLSGVLATSAVVTGVVAFSLQDTLGNVIGGMVLHLEDTFKPGDWIEIEKFAGIVREVRWRQTSIETLDGDLVIVPNIILMKSPVMVQGRAANNTRWRAVPFNVYYDRSPGEVEAVVNQAFREDLPAGVAPAPAPYCGIKDFQPNCVVYELRYYLSDLSSPGGTDSRVRSKIFYSLSRAGIKLSVHNRSLVLSEAARDAADRGLQSERERRLDALREVEVFEPLTEAELSLLAGKLKSAPFSRGEKITVQGAASDCLYIISSGGAEVQVSAAGSGCYTVVKKLGPGDVLGEMGLLTGEPRTATVVASEEVNCYRLDRDNFRGVLASRPEIAEAIAAIMAKRRLELSAARERLAGDAAAGLKSEAQNLLSRIRDFFKL
jgi:small-conductance mechanosensitive channel/CRP-like cAMP-binding protein